VELNNLDGEKNKVIIPDFVNELSASLHKIYLVGGALRDLYSGYTPHDFDFAVSSLDTVAAFLGKKKIKFFMINKENFPFLRAIINHNTFDFTELYVDMETDRNRRDFTINTLYYDIKKCKMITNETALKDIKNKVLRVVNKNAVKADPIRVMRAVRLIAKYALRISPETAPILKNGFELLLNTKTERRNEEMRKMINLPYEDILMAFSKIFEKKLYNLSEKIAQCSKFSLLQSEISKGVSYEGLYEIYLISSALNLKESVIFGLTDREEDFINVLKHAYCNFETLFDIFIKKNIQVAVASALLYCGEKGAMRVEQWKDVKIKGDLLKEAYHIDGKEIGKLKTRKMREECRRIYENI